MPGLQGKGRAFILVAIVASRVGEMTLSLLATMYQLGRPFQATLVTGGAKRIRSRNRSLRRCDRNLFGAVRSWAKSAAMPASEILRNP